MGEWVWIRKTRGLEFGEGASTAVVGYLKLFWSHVMILVV